MSTLSTTPVLTRCSGAKPEDADDARACAGEVEIIECREVPLGGPRAMDVRRTLPQRQRSMIGAWCFVDHYGPDRVADSGGMDVAPHPHTGLQTVSWLFEGEIEHRDSGGNTGIVRPGEVNLMTAGGGICHSETSTPDTEILHGVQLWLALPDSVRKTAPRAFEHYVPSPVRLDGAEALVFLGELLGESSPVTTHTPLLGAEVRIDPHREILVPVNPAFEYGLLVDAGDVALNDVPVPESTIGYTGTGSEQVVLTNRGSEPARMVLLGGEPFGEEIVMWWNFVGRTSEEIHAYREAWQRRTEQFGWVEGYVGHGGPNKNALGMSWLPAPVLPQVEMRPRRTVPPRAQTDLPPADGTTASDTR